MRVCACMYVGVWEEGGGGGHLGRTKKMKENTYCKYVSLVLSKDLTEFRELSNSLCRTINMREDCVIV